MKCSLRFLKHTHWILKWFLYISKQATVVLTAGRFSMVGGWKGKRCVIQVSDYNFPAMTLYAFYITEFSGCSLLCWTILIRPSLSVSVHTHRWTDISEYHIIFRNLRDGRREGDRTQVLSSILHGFLPFFFWAAGWKGDFQMIEWDSYRRFI